MTLCASECYYYGRRTRLVASAARTTTTRFWLREVHPDLGNARGRVASLGMAVNPRDMDGFMPLLSTTDIKKKLNVGNALLNFLGDSSNSIECQDIGIFIDNVIPWLGNGNPKVSLFEPRVASSALNLYAPYIRAQFLHLFCPFAGLQHACTLRTCVK